MSLLVCDSSLNLIISHVLYHSTMVDEIVCIVNKPSQLMIYILSVLEKSISNFKVIGVTYDAMSIPLQGTICTKMTKYLGESGCDWVIPCDDDEFYVGDIRQDILAADSGGFNVLYQDGFCFYTTVEGDNLDLNPVRNMVYRDQFSENYAFRKAIHKTENFSKCLHGNHWIEFTVPSRAINLKNLLIFHYHHRERRLFNDNKLKILSPLTSEQVKEKDLIKDTSLIEALDKRGLP